MSMKKHLMHDWNVTPKEAKDIREQLRNLVEISDFDKDVFTIAGIDVSVREQTREGIAVIIVQSYPRMEIIESVSTSVTVEFPYIPGFLSFREAPAVLKSWQKLKNCPEFYRSRRNIESRNHSG